MAYRLRSCTPCELDKDFGRQILKGERVVGGIITCPAGFRHRPDGGRDTKHAEFPGHWSVLPCARAAVMYALEGVFADGRTALLDQHDLTPLGDAGGCLDRFARRGSNLSNRGQEQKQQVRIDADREMNDSTTGKRHTDFGRLLKAWSGAPPVIDLAGLATRRIWIFQLLNAPVPPATVIYAICRRWLWAEPGRNPKPAQVF